MDLTWYDELEARIPTGTVRTRFAPSPTGYITLLHSTLAILCVSAEH